MRTAVLFICACLFIGCGHTNKQQSVSGTPEENRISKQENRDVAPKGNAANGDVTYYVFVRDGRRHFVPQMMAAGETALQWIFPVPEANTVGTLDGQSNGIVFLKFGGFTAEPESRVVAKDYGKRIYDNYEYRFSPNYSDDMIVYSQTRIAVMANVKTGEAFYARCGLSMGDYLLGIRFLDPQKNLFVIAKVIDEGNNGWNVYLHVAKADDQKLVDTLWSKKIGVMRHISHDFPLYNNWQVHNKNLFVYDSGRILCTDGNRPVPHPFSEVFNGNAKRFGVVKDIAIHPKLPFGVIIEESADKKTQDIVVLRWDTADTKKNDERIISFGEELEPLKHVFEMLSTDRMVLAYQSFSPDGNWYVVGVIADDGPKNPYFIAVPVVASDDKRPNFLDMSNLTVLGQVKNMTSIAWTFEPTSYVVSDGELLRKWDLNELPNARVFVRPMDE